MAGWDGNANWNRDVLERIAALLFALADLADLAAGAPFLRRRQVLGILSRCEAEARDFVMGVAADAPAPADAPALAGDAACLAARFRALASLLCAMLAQATLFGLPAAAGPQASLCQHAGPAGWQAPPPAPDTS